MARIPEDERVPLASGFGGHWAQADALDTPIEIAPGFGHPQFVALVDQYQDKREEVASLESQLEYLRAERDSLFGRRPDDEAGVWFRLRQYKRIVRLKLGAKHPLSKTVPNLGDIMPRNYLSIINRFINHWTRVDAALGTPLTLGAFGIAELQAAHDAIEQKQNDIEAIDEGSLPLARAEREKIFGDMPEEERDDESIVARLQLYVITIETQFPGQPIADSLPTIFPSQAGSAATQTFRFNSVALPNGQLKTWHEVLSLPGADAVYLKEGAFEHSEPLEQAAEGGVQVIVWSGVTIVDELDEYEIRSASGVTLARGERDTAFAEPVPASSESS